MLKFEVFGESDSMSPVASLLDDSTGASQIHLVVRVASALAQRTIQRRLAEDGGA